MPHRGGWVAQVGRRHLVTVVYLPGTDQVDTESLRVLQLRLLLAADQLAQAADQLGAASSMLECGGQLAPSTAPFARQEFAVAHGLHLRVAAGLEELAAAVGLACNIYESGEQTLAAVLAGGGGSGGLLANLGTLVAALLSEAGAPAVQQAVAGLAANLLALTGMESARSTSQGSSSKVAAPMPFLAGTVLESTGLDEFQGHVLVTPHPGVVREVTSMAGLIEYSEQLAAESGESGTGRLGVLRRQSVTGSVAWTVVLPGTREIFAHANPQDHLSNLQLMAGASSDLRQAVSVALEALPIRAGQSVSFVGHSQGGMVATELAADPRIRKELKVTGVITMGSPVGHRVAVPEDTQVINVESAADLVPALDGLANETSRNHVTVVFEPREPIPGSTMAHDLASYEHGIAAAKGQSPVAKAQFEAFEREQLWQESGQTTAFTFEFERTDRTGTWARAVEHRLTEH